MVGRGWVVRVGERGGGGRFGLGTRGGFLTYAGLSGIPRTITCPAVYYAHLSLGPGVTEEHVAGVNTTHRWGGEWGNGMNDMMLTGSPHKCQTADRQIVFLFFLGGS